MKERDLEEKDNQEKSKDQEVEHSQADTVISLEETRHLKDKSNTQYLSSKFLKRGKKSTNMRSRVSMKRLFNKFSKVKRRI